MASRGIGLAGAATRHYRGNLTRSLVPPCVLASNVHPGPAADELTQAGVAHRARPRRPFGARGDGLSVYFRDPDANLIELRTYTA